MSPKYILLIALICTATSGWAQIPTPGKLPTKAVVLTGGIVHVGNGEVLENMAIGMEQGRITFIKPTGAVKLNSEEADIIDITAQHVYPGFISPNNTLGLTEIDAVRATRDFAETGVFNPEVRALTSYNTDNRISPTVRTNGVLITQATPRSGTICGTSAIMHLDGWSWEDAVLRADDGIHVNWPQRFIRTGWWAQPGPTKTNEKYEQEVNELREFMNRAKAYEQHPGAPFNQKMEACKGLFDGSQRLYIHVNDAKGIMESVLFAQAIGAKKPVVVGATEAWLVTEFLSTKNIPVILKRPFSLPVNTDDYYDQPYRTAKALQDANILFGIDYAGDMEAMGSRNLPFAAGALVAAGLTKEQALQTITANTAKILGIDHRCGTLAPGKDATLIVSTGDALDPLTNQITHAFIQGKPVDLDNSQKYLYRKFKATIPN